MEALIIALICTAAFGVVAALAAFIHQLLLSRNKRLNDKAMEKALVMETKHLDEIRLEMASPKRYLAPYELLGDNKESIRYLDQKIEEIFAKKSTLIHKFIDESLLTSSAFISNEAIEHRKEELDDMRKRINEEIAAYNEEIKNLQERRANLCKANVDFNLFVLDQEKRHNENLDALYLKHSVLIEKMYARYAEDNEKINQLTIKASTEVSRFFLDKPLEVLKMFFSKTLGFSMDSMKEEEISRREVMKYQEELNNEVEETDTDIDSESTNKFQPVI